MELVDASDVHPEFREPAKEYDDFWDWFQSAIDEMTAEARDEDQWREEHGER